jgi:hypothetical protein
LGLKHERSVREAGNWQRKCVCGELQGQEVGGAVSRKGAKCRGGEGSVIIRVNVVSGGVEGLPVRQRECFGWHEEMRVGVGSGGHGRRPGLYVTVVLQWCYRGVTVVYK